MSYAFALKPRSALELLILGITNFSNSGYVLKMFSCSRTRIMWLGLYITGTLNKWNKAFSYLVVEQSMLWDIYANGIQVCNVSYFNPHSNQNCPKQWGQRENKIMRIVDWIYTFCIICLAITAKAQGPKKRTLTKRKWIT